MGYRDITPPNADIDIFESREPTGVKSPLQRFSLPAMKLSATLQIGVGLLVMLFGATTAGSYFSATSRFKGILATVFYEWQVATIILVIGMLLIYSALQKR